MKYEVLDEMQMLPYVKGLDAKCLSPKWIERFFDSAKLFATWSKDSTQVGTVISYDDCKIAGVGYNGLLPGVDDNLIIDDRDFKIANVIHSEQNALANMNQGIITRDLYMFVTHPVCSECAKYIALNGNVKHVLCLLDDDETFKSRWNNERAVAILSSVGISYTEFKEL